MNKEVKWWNWRLLALSALVGIGVYGLILMLAERIKPPEGYVFERLPVISGTYRLPRSSSRYNTSWVGPNVIQCGPIGYYAFGYTDCGRRTELDGRQVEVLQVLAPTSSGVSPLVMKISADGQKYYERSDARLRELWISGTDSGASTIGWTMFLIVHFIQLVYLNRHLNKTKGEPHD